MADVFISYSKARSVEAAELASELADLGYDVWWDTSLLPTGSFGAEIDRQLDAAKAVIVIWSPESLRSKWVGSEASHGDRQDKLVNTHTADPGVVAGIPKPLDLIHSVGLDNIRAIVGALDRLRVPRSRGATPPPVAVVVSAADADHRLFAEVEKAATAEAYQFYLDEFPQGAHAPVARFKLRGATPTRVPASASEPAAQQQGLVSLDVCLLKPGSGKLQWFKDLEIGPEMVVVPAGGTITAPFAIGRFALTFAEWDMAQAKHDWEKLSGIAPRKPEDRGWGRGKQPVITVSWEDAKAYCKWLSAVTARIYRLPSEAEWEHACRAGTTTEYSFGDDAKMLGDYAWYSDNADGKSHPVGEKKPNQWGLFDVHGNVWEWCGNTWNASSSSRVLRGGSWNNTPNNLRSANRNNNQPDNRNNNVGFRLARTLDPRSASPTRLRQNRHDHGLAGCAQGGVCGSRCVHLVSRVARRAFRAVHDETAWRLAGYEWATEGQQERRATAAPVLGPSRPTGAVGLTLSRASNSPVATSFPMAKSAKTTPTWTSVKRQVADFDRAGLLLLLKDLYETSRDNQAFPHARLGLGDAPLAPYKKTISRWINPDVMKGQDVSVANAKKAISDYQKAIARPGGVAEL